MLAARPPRLDYLQTAVDGRLPEPAELISVSSSVVLTGAKIAALIDAEHLVGRRAERG
jgi:hypothetical protein